MSKLSIFNCRRRARVVRPCQRVTRSCARGWTPPAWRRRSRACRRRSAWWCRGPTGSTRPRGRCSPGWTTATAGSGSLCCPRESESESGIDHSTGQETTEGAQARNLSRAVVLKLYFTHYAKGEARCVYVRRPPPARGHISAVREADNDCSGVGARARIWRGYAQRNTIRYYYSTVHTAFKK